MKKKETLFKAMVVLSFVVAMIVNTLSFVLPINGKTMTQISNSYPNLFAPADYTFSIWGIVYLLLLLFTFYQLRLLLGNKEEREILQPARIVSVTTNLLNAARLIAWHFDYLALSVMLIFVMLITLQIYGKLIRDEKLSSRETILLRLPFSIYYGWITVAAVASSFILMESVGWNGYGLPQMVWVVIVLIILTSATAFRTLQNRDIAFCITFIWSYIGILVRHVSKSHFNGAYPIIIITLVISVIVLTGCIGYLIADKKRIYDNIGLCEH